MRRVALALCILALALPVYAQVQSGSIYGTVQDQQGGVLPGAVVTLAGPDRTATFTTESDGKYRFLNLSPGTYTLTVALPGFSKVTRENIVVVLGKNVEIPFTLKLASLEQSVTVTSASPIIDTKQVGTATDFTQAELAQIPTSRDPFALARSVPGVLVDRVNIAGNETGQQSNFVSKATRPQDAVWMMDGVNVTDMAAVGASPTYFNWDNFDEVQVSTTGQDIRQPTGGMGINLVVKRGTNRLNGDARGYFTNHNLESTNVPAELSAIGVTPATADHNQQVSDYGGEVGGPIVKDHAWFYGSYSDQDIRLARRRGNLVDRTLLKDYDVKGNWQATKKDMVSVLWFLGSKEKNGRSPGDSGITFDAPTATFNQGNAYPASRPHGLLKIEDDRVMTPNFFLTAKYAYYGTGFTLTPVGGLAQQAGQSTFLAQSFGSTRRSVFLRPEQMVNVDTNIFKNAIGFSHEFKIGTGYRRTDASSDTVWPGNMVLALDNSSKTVSDLRARVYREGNATNRTQYYSAYAADTLSRDRLTLDLGVRYDRQWGSALPSSAVANAAFPDVVPGFNFAGYTAPFTWNNVSPRVGATYSINQKTVARASYTRSPGQLNTGTVGYANPGSAAGYEEYRWVDLNGDHFAQANEVMLNSPIGPGNGFNPANPTAVVSANKIDPNLKAPITTGVVVGLDREVRPDLSIGVNYSYTRTTNLLGNFFFDFTPWVGLTTADYAPGLVLSGTLPDGTPYAVPTYIPNASLIAANGNSRMLTNWSGYYTTYHGVELSMVKRLSHHWMSRATFSYNNPREFYGASPANHNGNPTRTETEPLVTGGQYAPESGGSGSGEIFINAKWQVNLNALYQLPYGFDVGANVFGRQGYPFPIFQSAKVGTDPSPNVLVTPRIDTFRFPNLWDGDIRVAKKFALQRTNIQIMGDLFNVMNANTALVRVRNITSPTFDLLAQNLSPRILRIGVKVGF